MIPDNRKVTYFLDDMSNHLKIGSSHTGRLAKRIKQLQTGNAQLLTLVLAVDAKWLSEKEAHSMFRRLRVNGEWYHNDDNILTRFVESILENPPCDIIAPGRKESR